MSRSITRSSKKQVFAQNEDTKKKEGHVQEEEEESLEGNTKTVAKKKSDGVKEHEVGGGGAGAGVQGDDDDGGKARKFSCWRWCVVGGVRRQRTAFYRCRPRRRQRYAPGISEVYLLY